MQDVSNSLSSGLVDTLHFMGSSKEQLVQAPHGLLRQDITLGTQAQDHHRRLIALEKHKALVIEVRNKANIYKGGSRSVSRGADSSGPLPMSGELFPPGRSPSNGTATSCDWGGPRSFAFEQVPTPAASPADASVVMNSEASRTPAAESVATSSAALFRDVLSLHERYLPCYLCARDVLHCDFESHLRHCLIDTEALLRKSFLSTIRFAEFRPKVPVPPLSCGDDELDDYARECSRCLGASLVDCKRCKRRYNIHEIAKHSAKCIGRKAGEILGPYAAYINLPK